jgi:hypothetical protein
MTISLNAAEIVYNIQHYFSIQKCGRKRGGEGEAKCEHDIISPYLILDEYGICEVKLNR